jgi:hypothetical protein
LLAAAGSTLSTAFARTELAARHPGEHRQRDQRRDTARGPAEIRRPTRQSRSAIVVRSSCASGRRLGHAREGYVPALALAPPVTKTAAPPPARSVPGLHVGSQRAARPSGGPLGGTNTVRHPVSRSADSLSHATLFSDRRPQPRDRFHSCGRASPSATACCPRGRAATATSCPRRRHVDHGRRGALLHDAACSAHDARQLRHCHPPAALAEVADPPAQRAGAEGTVPARGPPATGATRLHRIRARNSMSNRLSRSANRRMDFTYGAQGGPIRCGDRARAIDRYPLQAPRFSVRRPRRIPSVAHSEPSGSKGQ